MVNRLSDLVLIFFFYAFLGWCLEVVYATTRTKRFVNRGFLNGPYCPVYGFGVLTVLILLQPIEYNIWLYFLGSCLLTSSIEFITGYILEKSFRKKWWDYSKEFLNIKGYICIRATLTWGLACVVMFYLIQPPVLRLVLLLPHEAKIVLAIIFVAAILTDLVITICSLFKVRNKIRLLSEVVEKIRHLSDTIGKNLSENTVTAMQRNEKHKNDLAALNDKYQSILNKRTLGYNRIAKAFPRLEIVPSKKAKRPSKKDN